MICIQFRDRIKKALKREASNEVFEESDTSDPEPIKKGKQTNFYCDNRFFNVTCSLNPINAFIGVDND